VRVVAIKAFAAATLGVESLVKQAPDNLRQRGLDVPMARRRKGAAA
jgi:hypothetical protein